jgi:hypothetical protein
MGRCVFSTALSRQQLLRISAVGQVTAADGWDLGRRRGPGCVAASGRRRRPRTASCREEEQKHERAFGSRKKIRRQGCFGLFACPQK